MNAPETLLTHDSLANGRIPSLDGLRAVAIGLVVLAHAAQTPSFPAASVLRPLGALSVVGVDVFFVLSGFLITTLLRREAARNGRISIRSFYVRRAFRIIPAYAFFLLTVVVLHLAGVVHIKGVDWLAALTYTMNFQAHPTWEVGHLWSLSIEEHFYLLWPLVMGVAAARFARDVAITAILGCFALRWMILLFLPAYSPMAELWTFTRLDSIAAGCLLAVLAGDTVWRTRLDLLCRPPIVIMAVLALLVSSIMAELSGKFSVGISLSVNAASIAVLTWAAIRKARSLPGRALNHPLVAAIGVGSYSLYLWQQLFLARGHDDVFHRFPQNILFAAVAAFLSFKLIERPFLALRDRIAAGKPEHVAVSV